MSKPHAVEIDTKLADAHYRLAEALRRRQWASETLRRNAGQKRDRQNGWSGRLSDAVTYHLRSENAWDKRDLADYQARVQAHGDISVEVEMLNNQYTGWSRFFLVTNASGHIHSSMSCTTCYDSTEFAWLPELSGETEAEAVAQQGEILCSICFPSAPVAWTTGVSRASVEARGARDAKKAAAAAKKAEKALGTVLRVRGGSDRIETIAAAKMYLTDATQWNAWSDSPNGHPSYPAADIALVALTLAERLGTTVAEEIAAADKRAAKRK